MTVKPLTEESLTKSLKKLWGRLCAVERQGWGTNKRLDRLENELERHLLEHERDAEEEYLLES